MTRVLKELTLNSGGKIPTIGLGTWTFWGQTGPADQLYEAVKVAISAGYRHIDTALIYGVETEIGKALEEKIEDGTVKREDMFITTKLWNTHHDPKTVRKALETSLRNLRTSYVDLYQMHWPMAFQDADVDCLDALPTDKDGNLILADHAYLDVWRAMEECKKAGLTRHIGLCNFNSKQITNILENCSIQPCNLQIEVTPYLSNKDLIKFCRDRGIVVTAYSPFGAPTRLWRKEGEPIVWDEPLLQNLAAKKGKTIAQILLRYHLQNGLVVIPKSVTPSRICENIKVFDFELSHEEMETIASLDRGFRAYMLEISMAHPDFPFH